VSLDAWMKIKREGGERSSSNHSLSMIKETSFEIQTFTRLVKAIIIICWRRNFSFSHLYSVIWDICPLLWIESVIDATQQLQDESHLNFSGPLCHANHLMSL
jgi:hypothetical protein